MNQVVISAKDARHIVLTWWMNLFFAEINRVMSEGWTTCHVTRDWVTSFKITRRYPPQFVLDNMKKLGYDVEVLDTTIRICWD
jgi:hypothetical protein